MRKRCIHSSLPHFVSQDFDIDAFDAFCVLVCEDKYEAEIGDAFLKSTRAPFSTRSIDLPVAQMDVEKNGRGTEQNEESHSQVCK